MHTYACTHTHIHTHTHTRTHTHARAHAHARTHARTHQTAAAHFLASAKTAVLLISALKAMRVSSRRRRLQRLHASRTIATALRLHLARSRVARLRWKHTTAVLALQDLSELRQREQHRRPFGWAWSGMSLPTDLSQLGGHSARLNSAERRDDSMEAVLNS